jgi:hypothetical protein
MIDINKLIIKIENYQSITDEEIELVVEALVLYKEDYN